MASFFIHFYTFAETYAVLLVWITVPLAFYASYLFMDNHFGMFRPPSDDVNLVEREQDHGAH